MARCHFPFPVWHMLKCSSHAMPCRIVACGTSAKCPWQATSGVILPLLQPLIYYRLTAPKVGHKVDASNTWGKLTHDVRYFSSFWFEILMQYIQTYSMYYMLSICVCFLQGLRCATSGNQWATTITTMPMQSQHICRHYIIRMATNGMSPISIWQCQGTSHRWWANPHIWAVASNIWATRRWVSFQEKKNQVKKNYKRVSSTIIYPLPYLEN